MYIIHICITTVMYEITSITTYITTYKYTSIATQYVHALNKWSANWSASPRAVSVRTETPNSQPVGKTPTGRLSQSETLSPANTAPRTPIGSTL